MQWTIWCQNEPMRIENWWPLLDPSTREWLINNNGDVVPPHILDRIVAVAGPATSGAAWVGDNVPKEFTLSDGAIDWIETMANDEVPPDQ